MTWTPIGEEPVDARVLWEPNEGPQTSFLAATAREVLYGGAMGGGKSEAVCVAPLRWADHPLHRAIILRRERKLLQEIIDRSRQLYPEVMPGARWHETEGRWYLPAGGFIWMGYAEHETDIEKFKTFEFNQVLFDELTEFTEYQYRFMLSRNRSKAAELPSQMRAATNPGGEGMAWVDQRFLGIQPDGTQRYLPYKVYPHEVSVEGLGALVLTRQFIPSTVFDNPKLPNRDQYIAGLADLDEAEREAYLYGRWSKFRGQYFPKSPREVEPGIKKAAWYLIRCMDYGWGDPTAVLWLFVYPSLHVVEVAAELYSPGLTTDSIAHMITATEQDLSVLPSKVHHSVLSPDAFNARAEGDPTIAQNLMSKGVWFTKANNERISGWAQIAKLIARDELRVWRGRAPNLMRTLPKLPRDPNRPNDVRQKNVEDHAPEALRYGCMAYFEEPVPALTKDEPKPSTTTRVDPYWDALQRALARGQEHGGVIPGLGSGW